MQVSVRNSLFCRLGEAAIEARGLTSSAHIEECDFVGCKHDAVHVCGGCQSVTMKGCSVVGCATTMDTGWGPALRLEAHNVHMESIFVCEAICGAEVSGCAPLQVHASGCNFSKCFLSGLTVSLASGTIEGCTFRYDKTKPTLAQ